MASACDGITLVSVKDENGDIWDGLNDFGTLDCCRPKTLEFVYKNDWDQPIRIDNLEPDLPCGEADITDDGGQGYEVSSVSGLTQGEIGPGEFFSVWVTVDPGLLDCEVAGQITGTLNIYTIEVGGVGGCCTFQQEFSATLIKKVAPTIDLGAQGNNDGYLQMTAVIGTPISKGITIRNTGSSDRTYTVTEPPCWAGRFTVDQDIFTPFTISGGGSIDFNFTYTPTVEEIDCCEMAMADDCESPYSFTLCFEAVPADDAPDPDPDPPVDPDPPGGPPPCQSMLNCDTNDIPLQQLLRSAIISAEDGCPAIRIILT